MNSKTTFGPKPKQQGAINCDANRDWAVQRADNLQRLFEEAKADQADALYQAENAIRVLVRTIDGTGDDAYGVYLGGIANIVNSIARTLDNKQGK